MPNITGIFGISMKPKFVHYYMNIAKEAAKLSYAKRLQVGAVIVTPSNVVLTGYNGMPTDWENVCENEIVDHSSYEGAMYTTKLVTKPEVLHAEMNAVMKVAQSTESSKDATLFCTHAPCMDCAKAIYQAGITTLYYKDTYRDDSGLKFLVKSGINVHQYSERTQS